ncbi:unnamed protein product [Rhizophagus irregularis]|nr:unnamed protein product [Rhizophagus irregularis]CAB5185165.1 unnamed protein product [Rhizophagus irregularis]
MKEESGEPQLRWIKKYGNIIKVHGIFNEPIVFVADPKIIQDISVTRAYDFIKPPGLLADSIAVAGRGLIYAEGDDHKRQRKMINPAFTHSKIKEMVPRSIPIVMTLKEKISKEELKYQIKTFLVAGHESTSVSICWALYYLSQNLHEQDLLREELVKAFPDKSKFNPTFDELNSLEYLNCVIKETLRLASPATSARRTNTKDEVFGDYYIPKDTIIMMAISGQDLGL